MDVHEQFHLPLTIYYLPALLRSTNYTNDEARCYLLNEKPPFAAGQGWDYSETNYIVRE